MSPVWPLGQADVVCPGFMRDGDNLGVVSDWKGHCRADGPNDPNHNHYGCASEFHLKWMHNGLVSATNGEKTRKINSRLGFISL